MLFYVVVDQEQIFTHCITKVGFLTAVTLSYLFAQVLLISPPHC